MVSKWWECRNLRYTVTVAAKYAFLREAQGRKRKGGRHSIRSRNRPPPPMLKKETLFYLLPLSSASFFAFTTNKIVILRPAGRTQKGKSIFARRSREKWRCEYRGRQFSFSSSQRRLIIKFFSLSRFVFKEQECRRRRVWVWSHRVVCFCTGEPPGDSALFRCSVSLYYPLNRISAQVSRRDK